MKACVLQRMMKKNAHTITSYEYASQSYKADAKQYFEDGYEHQGRQAIELSRRYKREVVKLVENQKEMKRALQQAYSREKLDRRIAENLSIFGNTTSFGVTIE